MYKIKIGISEKSKEGGFQVPAFFMLFFVLTELFLLSVCSEYGTACDQNNPCNTSNHLACIENVCRCASPSNQRFDNSSRKCYSVVGGPCSPENIGSPSNQSVATDTKRKECIANAHCVDVGDEVGVIYSECQCMEGFIENSMGNCVPGIGSHCNYQQDECNPLGMVVCKDNRCKCLDDLQVYDVDMKRCVLPAGTHCKYDSLQLGCVKNAICYPFFYWIPPKCLCKPGYIQTKSRQCVLESEYRNANANSGDSVPGSTNQYSQNVNNDGEDQDSSWILTPSNSPSKL